MCFVGCLQVRLTREHAAEAADMLPTDWEVSRTPCDMNRCKQLQFHQPVLITSGCSAQVLCEKAVATYGSTMCEWQPLASQPTRSPTHLKLLPCFCVTIAPWWPELCNRCVLAHPPSHHGLHIRVRPDPPPVLRGLRKRTG